MKRNSIWMAVLLMAFTSCVKTEYHYVDDSLKEWFVDRDKAVFQVGDQNGIEQDFRINDTLVDMVPACSYFMFVKTDDDLCENIHQDGRVTYYQGNAYSLSITNYYETSTHFSLYFYDVCFTLDVENGQFSCTEGVDDKSLGRVVPCSMEMLDSHEVNGVTYHDVMHFKITDWDVVSTRNTFPSELYFAKHYGPIEYELGGTVRIKRL
ncbi:MAG: hypothetical protein J6W30_07095 [Bacteroidales bacterium]|nr:hypothetical protein [Bacteroidales bacterium]